MPLRNVNFCDKFPCSNYEKFLIKAIYSTLAFRMMKLINSLIVFVNTLTIGPPVLYYYLYFIIISVEIIVKFSRDNSVGIATSYGLDDQNVGVRVPVGVRIFISPRCPDRLWGPPSLLYSGYRGLFRRALSGRGVKLTTHL
jgi:hypothetical protein